MSMSKDARRATKVARGPALDPGKTKTAGRDTGRRSLRLRSGFGPSAERREMTMESKAIAIGDELRIACGNQIGVVTRIRPMGTVDVETKDGSMYRISGLPIMPGPWPCYVPRVSK